MNEVHKRILVVDDEERIRRLVRLYLERNDFIVDESGDGITALEMAMDEDYALIILDLIVPGMGGRDVCLELRKYKATPVIMLTPAGEENTRIHCFEMGADDCVVKPFSPRELVMRVKALLRRSGSHISGMTKIQKSEHILSFPGLVINFDACKIIVEDNEVPLSPIEVKLLFYLVQRPEKVLRREELLREVWNYQFFNDQRTVDTHVRRLRQKLRRSSFRVPQYIQTVWGVGYKFEVVESILQFGQTVKEEDIF